MCLVITQLLQDKATYIVYNLGYFFFPTSFPCLKKKLVLLRCNSYTIQSTHLKGTIQCIHSSVHHHQLILEGFYHLKNKFMIHIPPRSPATNHAFYHCSVQFSCSVMSNSATPGSAARQASLSITDSRRLLRLMSIELVMPSNHLILCRPFSSHLQSFPASGYFQVSQLFPAGGQSTGVPASASVLPVNEYSGLISFRMDWLDLLAVQGTLKSLLQYHSSKASILWCSAFSMFQLSHPYMTPGKIIALTR